jgi:hypothetical protein
MFSGESMRVAGVFALLCCLFVCAVTVRAQNAGPLSAVPAGKFQFTGTWDCEGAFRNQQVHKSVFTGAIILDGKWIELTEQDVQPATGYLAKYLIGYDTQQKRLVEFDANNFGAATYSSQEGWREGTLAMVSPLSQAPGSSYVANRFLYSITGPDTFAVDWQISRTAALDWIPSDHLACKRRSNG